MATYTTEERLQARIVKLSNIALIHLRDNEWNKSWQTKLIKEELEKRRLLYIMKTGRTGFWHWAITEGANDVPTSASINTRSRVAAMKSTNTHLFFDENGHII